MRRLVLTASLLIIVFSCSQGQSFQVVPDSAINLKEVEQAKILASNILEAQKSGGYYSLSDAEAEAQMKNGLTEALQKRSYQQIKGLFGDYETLTFGQALKASGATYIIYRFKGKFEKNDETEIRVVMSESGKLAGFFIKPWMEQLR